MSNFVRHERCPVCAAQGKDRNGNNLGVYSDGSCYCFSCGYTKSSKGIERLKEATQKGDTILASPIYLPGDSTLELPGLARDYLRNYSLTEEDINVNRIMWSEQYQRVIFPYFDGGGLLGWQGRYLGSNSGKGKWFSQGDLKDILHICETARTHHDQRSIVLVEDIISAIRVGHTNPAAPLFGSHLSTKTALRYNKLYDNIILWLDKDKELYSIKVAQQLRAMGIPCRSVITDKDPKEYSDTEIVDILK